MLRSGDEIGPYTLISKLGRGAFGVVWLAERRTQITTTTAAVKIPLDEDISVESIKHEADLWVRASGHPNVLPIIEANIYDDQIIIASEYAPDGSLDAFLKKGGKARSIEEAVEIVSGILAGLEHLHSRNIIHRDLKPANILFQGDTPRLADFGISRVLKSTSQSSIVAGTPSYMAPEAFDGKRNEQTDIWSVGVIFYQLLAGRLPFAQEDITSLLGAILTRDPEPLPREVPAGLQNVIARALAKDPNQRYKSAAEMRKALRNPHETDPNFQAEKSVFTVQSAPVNTLPPQPVHLQSEKRNNAPHFIYAIAGLLAVVIVVGGSIFLFRSSSTNSSLSTNNNSVATSSETQKNTVSNSQKSSQSNSQIEKPTPNQQLEKRDWSITVLGTDKWRDTGIEIQTGQRISISAKGSVIWDEELPAVNPDGTFSASSVQNPSDFPLPQAGCGSLVMRIGNNKYAVGSNSTITAQTGGTIQFIVNDRMQSFGNNSGSFTVHIKLL